MTSPVHAYSAEPGIRRYAVDHLWPHPISVTSLIKLMAPGPALSRWIDKKLINEALQVYMSTGKAELAMSAGLGARFAGSPEADLGTTVHALTEQADFARVEGRKAKLSVPDMANAKPYLKQWNACIEEFDMQILAVEVTLVHPEMGYAGTADRIVVVPAISQDPIVLDLKTGKDIHDDAGLQCAGLSRCTKILHADGSLTDVPWQLNQDVALAAHLRPRFCRLIPLNIEAAWPFFEPLPKLAGWRTGTVRVVGSALEPDEEAHLRANVRLRVRNLPRDLVEAFKKTVEQSELLRLGSTLDWDFDQLQVASILLESFEQEGRDRVNVIYGAFDGGETELRIKILESTQGRTPLARELSAREVDTLLAAL